MWFLWILGLHEKVWHMLRSSKTQIEGSKLRRAKIEVKFAFLGFRPLNLCPAEFWTPQSVLLDLGTHSWQLAAGSWLQNITY